MAELVDALDLGSSAARCESSSLSFRTILSDLKSLVTTQQAKVTWKSKPVGLSPSGKATAFDAVIPWFESR
ncbi:conserved hypothetical protein [Photobacterium kishitanii]|nr:conserved hypothetical protein [Photobacterium kishitanii]